MFLPPLLNLFVFSSFWLFVKHFSYPLNLCHHSFFWDLESSLLYLLWRLFQAHCLSLLQLVVLLGFCLVSLKFLSGVILLTFCVCGLCSSGCRIVVLASAVSPPSWWGWSRGLTGLLLGGAAAHPRGVGLGLVSLAAGLCQRVCLEVAVGSGRHSAACLSVSRPVFPPAGWLFWGVPAPEPAGCWGGQTRGWPPGELMPMSGPWSLCHQCPRPPQRATASPHVPRTPEACRWFWPRFPGSRCLAPDPNARETLLSTCS